MTIVENLENTKGIKKNETIYGQPLIKILFLSYVFYMLEIFLLIYFIYSFSVYLWHKFILIVFILLLINI